MKVNIVIDNKESWFCGKVDRLINKINIKGICCEILFDSASLKKGSDFTFFLSCEKFITKEVRQKSNYNIVIHASDLPKGKGMSPTTWQILEGKNEIPVTLFEVGDSFDDGDYYLKDSFKLDGTELIEEWQEKLYICIEKMILNFINNYQTLKPIKQQGKSTFYQRRKLKDSEIDLNKTIKSQINLLRVVDNDRYPAFFNYKNKKYIIKIFKADN